MSDDIQALLARKKAALLSALDVKKDDVDRSDNAPENPNAEESQSDSSAKSNKSQHRRQRAKENKKLMKSLELQWREREAQRVEEIRTEKPEEEAAVKEELPDEMADLKAEYYDDEEKIDENGEKVTRKQRKQVNLVKVAHLKQIAPRPELVETHDVTAQDPHFLVTLKAYPNTVPVPAHWSQKRKFLDNKKGHEKPQFQLPRYIEDTGIAQLRVTTEERDPINVRKEMKERARPKMNRLDIDYAVLHDAFFVHQTRPPLSAQGEVYYENKELETPLKDIFPGRSISSELLRALGMADATPATPPPWLAAMQQHGPPPAYPGLLVPGVNAPLPQGAQWGPNPGEWGRPPVDAMGKGRWGDVFGEPVQVGVCGVVVRPKIDPVRGPVWGAIQRVSEDEEEEELAAIPTEVDAEAPAQGPAAETDSALAAHDVSMTHYTNTEAAAAALAQAPVSSGPRALSTLLGQEEVSAAGDKFGSSFVYSGHAQAEGAEAAAGLKRKREEESALERERAELERAVEEEAKKRKLDAGKKLDIF